MLRELELWGLASGSFAGSKRPTDAPGLRGSCMGTGGIVLPTDSRTLIGSGSWN